MFGEGGVGGVSATWSRWCHHHMTADTRWDSTYTVSYLLSATRGQRWEGRCVVERSVSSVPIWPQTSRSTTPSTSSPERRTAGGRSQAQQGPPALVREPPDWLSGTPRLSCEPPELWWCRRPEGAPTSSSSGLCLSSGLSDPERQRGRFIHWFTDLLIDLLID